MIDRRALIVSAAGSMLAASRVGGAQPARKVYRIGILGLRPTSDLVGPEPRSPSTKAFLRGMRELGYVYGEDFVTEPRGADGKPERFPTLARQYDFHEVRLTASGLRGLAWTGQSRPVRGAHNERGGQP